MKGKIVLLSAILIIAGLLLAACDGYFEQTPEIDNENTETVEMGQIVWNGESDIELAFAVDAQLNTTRNEASGIKITSNANSDEFPGIYFLWDSQQNYTCYLKAAEDVFNAYESFIITAKVANEYWDFLITPAEEQQLTEDGCYVFLIQTNNNKNINMVFISEWTHKEQAEDPADPEDPVVIPSDDITVSVSIDYELNGWDGDILVRLTLSEGEWDNFILWPYYGTMSNADMAAEKDAISQWITLSYTGNLYSPSLGFVGGGYDYIDIRTSPLENPSNNISVNEKVLIYRFRHGYFHPALVIGKEQIVNNLFRHFPFTVTLNEEKLDEMKAKTDITGNLTTGIKSATLDKLKEEDVIEVDLLEKYNLTMGTGIWNDYMPSIVYPLQSIFTIHFDSAVELPPMDVFATVITERITLPVSLYDIYNGKGTYGLLFRKDFRPVDHFRINDGEEYTLKIIIRIMGEQQTITTEKSKVFVTH